MGSRVVGVPPGLRVLAEIGRGAQTTVYRVHRGGTDYALKTMRAAAGDEAAILAFGREAALLACVADRHIPRVREVGVADGRPYLITDLISGRRLTEALATGACTVPQLLALGVEVAQALNGAHRVGVVHRDVKPDNIIIGEVDGVARLIDFGLAARTSTDPAGAMAGTLVYCAPEQAGALRRPVDARADLYALGVVLFECATGTPPFTAGDVGELIRRHASTPAPDPGGLRPDLPRSVAAIIGRLLAKDPDDRYQSAAGLLADLQRARELPAHQPMELGRDDGPTVLAVPPLLGRDTEVAALAARWERARAGHGGVVLLRGPAGSGKSRLVGAVLTMAAESGALVLQGASSEDDPVPLAPLRGAVDVSPARGARPDRQAATGEDRQEQVAVAVAERLTGLADRSGAAVLVLDDVQWLDAASRSVLAALGPRLATTPLLVLATARDDDAAPLRALGAALGPALDLSLALPPLTEETVAELIAALSGGTRLDAASAALLTDRIGGNPLALQQYLTALVDAGLLRPVWGRWLLDRERLETVPLPGTAVALVGRRLAALDDADRRLLGIGALVGARFDSRLVATVSGADPQRLHDVLSAACWQRLLRRQPGGWYAFMHGSAREALLAEFDEPTTRSMHQAIADALDAAAGWPAADATGDEPAPQLVYALASHCQRGLVEDNWRQVLRATTAAGLLALREHAPDQALAFLRLAADTAAAHPELDPDPVLLAALGVARHRTGDFAGALPALRAALAACPDPLRRAGILHDIARVHDSTWDLTGQIAAVEQAMAELGRPLPSHPVRLALSTLGQVAAGYLIGRTGIGRGGATGRALERYRLLARLHGAAALVYGRAQRPGAAAMVTLRTGYLASRIGPGRERAVARAATAYLVRMARLPRLADRLMAAVRREAAVLDDPQLLAYVSWLEAIAIHACGGDDGARLRQVLDGHGRWLDVGHHLDGLIVLCWEALLRGDMTDVRVLFARLRERIASARAATGRLIAAEAGVAALLGHPGEAAAALQAMVAAPGRVWEEVDLLAARLLCAIERGDTGEVFDEVAAGFAALGLGHAQVLPAHHGIYVLLAHGRLEQARVATVRERAGRLAAARAAVTALGAVRARPLLAAYHRVAVAALLQLEGHPQRALAELDRAGPVLRRVDAPLVEFEAARVAARALHALQRTANAERQARYAGSIAATQGWQHRVRWIAAEFTTVDAATANSPSLPRRAGAGWDRHRDRLAALEQISLAASRVLDPGQLVRVAMDETVRLLNAERAMLFVPGDAGPRLVALLGRDADGNDLTEVAGYSSTLVAQVAQDRQPQVVTGTEDGPVLRSASIVAHDLRSIMAAPLQLDGRLLGVVYLDSRLARGIFTADDVGALVAIANYVAVSLETARAAQLEVAVARANQQRDLAETLRTAMAGLAGTLEPDEVLRRLAATVHGVLGGDRVLLLRTVADDLVAPVIGDASTWPAVRTAQATAIPAGTGVDGDGPGGDRAPVECWLAVPLVRGPQRVGTLLLTSQRQHVYGPAQADIAATLVDHGMIIFENARLFAEAQRLASIDALTGIANRRHFFEQADRRLVDARSRGGNLTALMIDIDHFKQVNDAHGHRVGDEVIRAVAQHLLGISRGRDVLGRYGGEEFAMLLPATIGAASIAAERLRATVAATPVSTMAGPVHVTISIGVATLADTDTDIGCLLDRADRCLYHAKQAGRDKVVAEQQLPSRH